MCGVVTLYVECGVQCLSNEFDRPTTAGSEQPQSGAPIMLLRLQVAPLKAAGFGRIAQLH
jgi:hypothetical protein